MGNQGKGYGAVLSHQEQHFPIVLQLLVAINRKLNMLIENAGMSEQLRALTEELRGPTDALAQAVAENQQPQ